MNRHSLGWAFLLAAPCWFGCARAATTCSISTVGVNFGSYDPTHSTAVAVTGTVSISCTYVGTGFNANVTIATGSSGTYTARTLVMGTQKLDYNLYLDTGHSNVFGNGSGGSYYYYGCWFGGTWQCPNGGGVSGSTLSGPIYALLPAGQDVSAGAYSDTMVVTVSY
jgi:spore coat protein U-like protein